MLGFLTLRSFIGVPTSHNSVQEHKCTHFGTQFFTGVISRTGISRQKKRIFIFESGTHVHAYDEKDTIRNSEGACTILTANRSITTTDVYVRDLHMLITVSFLWTFICFVLAMDFLSITGVFCE